MIAYLVLGPESSGTRLLTRILIGSGCVGDDGHQQRWDDHLPSGESAIVWRRSVPHAGEQPNIRKMVADLRGVGHDVQVVVTTRDWQAMALSQVANGHVDAADVALAQIRDAYRHIFTELCQADLEFVMVGYEGLVQRPRKTLWWLAVVLGLPDLPQLIQFYDGNAKHLDGEGAGGGQMRIQWNGPKVTRRVVGQYIWDSENGFVQDVEDPDVAAELLTEPGGLFVAESGDADSELATMSSRPSGRASGSSSSAKKTARSRARAAQSDETGTGEDEAEEPEEDSEQEE